MGRRLARTSSDGGYVTVGEYYNDEDPFRRTWLVKLDACGDLQWQGCEPVGIQEWQIQDSRLELYPNPARNLVRVVAPSGAGGSGGWSGLSIIDITGKTVFEMSNDELRMLNSEVSIDVSKWPSGLYTILLHSAVFCSKLIVE